MTIIDPTALALATSGDPAYLAAAAQLAVEVYTFGEAGRLLANRSVTEAFRPRIGTRRLSLRYGPATALLSVKRNGAVSTDVQLLANFSLILPTTATEYDSSFHGGELIEVSYVQGYPSEADVPAVYKIAVQMLASDPNFGPAGRGVSERSLGVVDVKYTGLRAALPPLVAALLDPYRDPRLAGFL